MSPAALRARLVTVAPVLLALGWFTQSLRAQRARRLSDEAALTQSARVAAAAVREGLEELRAREDERPYEQYSPYWSPPDLIAAQRSLAPSPLARVPTDTRLFGHFQLDPDAAVTTPLARDGASTDTLARADALTAVVQRALAPSLSGLTRRSPAALSPTNVQSQVAFNNSVLADIRAAQQGRNTLGAPIAPRNRVMDARPLHAPDEAAYTPMRWLHTPDADALYRVVTTDGASSVQGVVLDRDALTHTWLPAVLARHPSADTTLAITPRAASARCAARVPLPAPFDASDLCASPSHPRADSSLAWQLAALAAVLAVVAWATVTRERARIRAESLAARERAFVASVSHELRTPLTSLRMNAEMLHEGWVTDARRDRVIQQLVDESARLSRLIEDVLTFSRLTDGRAALKVADADLSACVASVIDRERPRFEARGMPLHTDIAPGVTARIDGAAVEQVLLNLLENAQKYAPGARVTVRVLARDSAAVLRVEDEGRGILKADRARVFERFVRTDAAVSSHVAGTGLGLAIVRGLARGMNGDATIVEAPGCVVEVTLPRG